MKNLLFPELTMDDLVFEHRNHAYGAFAIRKNYHKNMTIAFAIAVLIFVTVFLLPGILKAIDGKQDCIIDPEEWMVNEVFLPPNLEKVVVHQQSQSTPVMASEAIKTGVPAKIVDDIVQQKQDDHNDLTGTATNEMTNNPSNTEAITQNNTSIQGNTAGNLTGEKGSDDFVLVADELPVFGDGRISLSSYLANAVFVPQIARDNGIQGKVIVEFIIDKNGNVKLVKLLRGIGGGCDEEVIKAIQNMPKWKAGLQHGKPVNVKLILPVSIRLN